MVSLFESLFGSYEPIQSVVSVAEDGSIVYAYSPNFGIIASYIVVAIVIYSICRLVGILLAGSYK